MFKAIILAAIAVAGANIQNVSPCSAGQIEEFVKNGDMGGLREFWAQLYDNNQLSSQEYEEASRIILDDYLKKGNMRGFKFVQRRILSHTPNYEYAVKIILDHHLQNGDMNEFVEQTGSIPRNSPTFKYAARIILNDCLEKKDMKAVEQILSWSSSNPYAYAYVKQIFEAEEESLRKSLATSTASSLQVSPLPENSLNDGDDALKFKKSTNDIKLDDDNLDVPIKRMDVLPGIKFRYPRFL